MGSGWVLDVHPDLPVAQATGPGTELTLLGYALDPLDQGHSDEDVLGGLAALGTAEPIIEATANLGGRWVLIVATEGGLQLITDAVGLRQVFYTAGPGGRWCASQAGLIAAQAGIALDPDAAAFMRSLYFRAYREYWWPFDTTPYRGIRRLPPNHVLDVDRGEARRYWPRAAFPQRPLEAVVGEGAELLRGSLHAAARRGPLALTLTAGLDTRAILAASRDVRAQVLCYTLDPRTLGTQQADLEVPIRLAARLGLPHLVIGAAPQADPDFRRAYRESVDTPHAAWAASAEGIAAVYPETRLSVTASCSEIARAPEHWHDSPRTVTPRSLLSFANMDADGSGYALAALGRWLEGAAPAAERSGQHPLTLFYWENRIGSWLASGLAEWDVVHETCAPFACRRLLETLLASDVGERRGPGYRLHHALIERLWPEALREPVNPLGPLQFLRQSAKRGTFRALRATGAYRPVMGIYLRARSRRMERL